MPVNVSMRGVTNSSVRVLWRQPSHPNGIIQGYRLYYMQSNFTDVKTVRDPQENMNFLLEGLSNIRGLETHQCLHIFHFRPLHALQDLAEGLHLEERG